MALQHDRVVATADRFAALSDRMSTLLADVQKALEYNSDQAIDWAAAQTPAYINEEANGNLSGRLFSRQAVANAIGSFDWFRKLLTNQLMTGSQGDHLGNLNQLGNP